MNIKLKIFSGLLIAMITTIIACQHKSNLPAPAPPGNDSTTTTTTVDTGICFERDILPIFLSNCAKGGCHDAASHQEGYILDSYNNIMNTGDDDGIRPGDAGDSEIYESLVEDNPDKRMPMYPYPSLSSGQISLIRRWINEGAMNGTGCLVLCDTATFSYSAGVKPILEQNCVGCHNATVSSGGVNLSSYQAVLPFAQNGRLPGTIKHQVGYQAMPQGSAKLSDCKIRQVEKWIEAGAPNN